VKPKQNVNLFRNKEVFLCRKTCKAKNMEIHTIKSAEDLRRILEKTGSNLDGTKFMETIARIGMNDHRVVRVEKADGETFLHVLGPSESQI